jgi:hypothetical protein
MTSFTQDLFISYAHIDNQIIKVAEKGWVSRFHTTLEALLSRRLGKYAHIRGDDKFQSNDMFSDEITEKFTQTALYQDDDIQFGADLIIEEVENLKVSVDATLQKLKKTAAQLTSPSCGDDDTKLIYLICNEQDLKATVAVRKFRGKERVGIKIPIFEGDAIIVFYSCGDEAWKYTLDNKLKTLPGYRGDKPLLGRYTYLAQPTTTKKKDLINIEEDKLIDGLAEFSDMAMTDFMQVMNTGRKTL